MSQICEITGKKPLVGCTVSHANNKTKRRFNLNLQKKRFWLAEGKRWVTLWVSKKGMRTVDKLGIEKVLEKMSRE